MAASYAGPEARVAAVAVAEPLEPRVVGDVAGRLLEVCGEPRTLQDLRQQVRGPLAGDVRAAELRDRVVAVAEEDRLVQLRGALALGALPRGQLRQRDRELVEEEAAQCPGVARVAGEERALDRLRQVDEPEHGPVEVGEVRREARPLLLREALDRNRHDALDGRQGTSQAIPAPGRCAAGVRAKYETVTSSKHLNTGPCRDNPAAAAAGAPWLRPSPPPVGTRPGVGHDHGSVPPRATGFAREGLLRAYAAGRGGRQDAHLYALVP